MIIGKPLRIAFDIGGVLSKYPRECLALVDALVEGGAEVYVLTDMPDRDAALKMLARNGFGEHLIPSDRVISAAYNIYAEGCKAVSAEQFRLDVLVDDFPAYVARPGSPPLRLLVMPDIERPYNSPDWKI